MLDGTNVPVAAASYLPESLVLILNARVFRAAVRVCLEWRRPCRFGAF